MNKAQVEQTREQHRIERIFLAERENAKRIARSMRAFLNSSEGDDFLDLLDRWVLAIQRDNLNDPDDNIPRCAYRFAVAALENLKQSMVEYKDFAFEADAEDEDEEEGDEVVRDALGSFDVGGL